MVEFASRRQHCGESPNAQWPEAGAFVDAGASDGPDFDVFPTATEMVKHELFRALARGEPTIEAIAATLAISPGTLARRLKEEGADFPSLLANVRRSLAIEYVKQPGVGVDQIAMLLGYDGVAAFYHAFRRWTGVSPSMAQQFHRAPELRSNPV